MPDWLVDALVQYPIVLVVGLVAWYAHREMKKQAAEHRRAEKGTRDALVEKLEAANKKLVAAKDAEIKRLGAVIDKRLEAVEAAVRQLGGR